MSLLYDRVPPYEGSEPYIFISYSHKDTDRVMPVIRSLNENGFRVWYDEGIDPGSEWPESIAAHLAGSTVCMYFISENSLASSNCKREVNFALSKEIGFLSVALEKVNMSLGLELQISSYMSLLRYKYPSEELFLEKLAAVEILQPCRNVPEQIPEIPEEAPVPEVEKPAVKKTGPAKPKPKRKKPWWIFLPVAAVLLGLMVKGMFSNPARPQKMNTITIGDTEYKDYSTLEIVNEDIGTEEIQKILTLEKTSHLRFQNCRFKDGSLDGIREIHRLYAVSLEDCTGVTSLAFTESLENLRQLTAARCGITDEILGTLAQKDTWLEIALQGNSLTHLPDMSGWTSLNSLNISGNSISDLEPLKECPQLKALYAGNNQISDIRVLEPFIYLAELDLSDNLITSLDGLKNTTLLTKVNLSGNSGLTDLSVLANSAETLKTLVLERLGEADLSVLSGCTNITYLDITSANVSDLSFVSGMTRLAVLQAAGNTVTDITPLQNCTELTMINLAENNISSLNGFPSGSSNKYFVLLQDNQLASLNGLPSGNNYNVLTLENNPLTDLSALAETEGYYLVLDHSDAVQTDQIRQYSYILVTSLDLSKQVALEKVLGYRLKIVSETEAMDMIRNAFSGREFILPGDNGGTE